MAEEETEFAVVLSVVMCTIVSGCKSRALALIVDRIFRVMGESDKMRICT